MGFIPVASLSHARESRNCDSTTGSSSDEVLACMLESRPRIKGSFTAVASLLRLGRIVFVGKSAMVLSRHIRLAGSTPSITTPEQI